MTFTRKCLDIEFSLASGSFGSGGNGARKTGLRIAAKVIQPGGRDMGTLEAIVFGMKLSEMNQLTTLGTQYTLTDKNTVKLYAYEEGQRPNLVFTGTISLAYADMQAVPQAGFRVSAHAGLYGAVKPVEPTSIKGSADAAQVMEQVAKKGEWQFENNGVNVKLMNPYLSGSARSQALALAKAAGIEWTIHNDTLAIWKPGQTRSGGQPEISPTSGLIGYPRFNQAGVELTTSFNPQIQFGGKVKVKSDITPACGEWAVVYVDHTLESEVPRGKWETVISTTRLNIENPA